MWWVGFKYILVGREFVTPYPASRAHGSTLRVYPSDGMKSYVFLSPITYHLSPTTYHL